MKRTSRYVFIFGLGAVALTSKEKSTMTLSSTYVGAVAWTSNNKSTMILSSTYVAYVVEITTTCQIGWMRRILTELLLEYKEETQFFVTANMLMHYK